MTSTAVRVALRVRPLTQKERLSNCSECLTFIPNEPQILIGTDKSFTYDHVFNSNTAQDKVYATSAAPLLHKFMDGFNATILAYGQTGSGKTYSMGTGLDTSTDAENEGIVPRCIVELFRTLNARSEKDTNFTYEVYVSFLELYNEEFIDLLNPQSTTQKRRSVNSTGGTDVSIREDAAGNIYWSGVKEERCHEPDELLGFLDKGSLCRTTGSTEMNTVSSRSHAIFSVILKQTRTEQEEQENSQTPKPVVKSLTSKFHFVDLAGSERLKRTNAQGDRAREGIAINSGLLALGNVISALGDEQRRAAHVPYRDSRLTRLLQDSLGGNSQTLMLACVSPSDSNFMETLNTLKYANRARNIKNRITVNQDFAGSSIEVNQLRAHVARLRMEIAGLRTENGSGTYMPSHQDEDVRGLKSEIARLRERIQDTTAAMIQVTSERDTLLMERELGEFICDDDTQGESGAEAPGQVHAHPLISKYQQEIQSLTSELADTRDRLSFLENARPTAHAMAMAQALVSHSTSTTTGRPRPEPGASTSQKRGRRAIRRRRPGRVVATSSSTTSSSRLSTRRGHSSKSAGSTRTELTTDPDMEDDEDEGYVNDMQEEDVRLEVKESIAKVKADIRKGMELLELMKPLDDMTNSWEDEIKAFEDAENSLYDKAMERTPSDEGTFSAAPSPNHDELLEEVERMAVASWEHPLNRTPGEATASSILEDTSRASLSTVDPRFNSQLSRMLHQIQSDIRVKEELVSHLEKSETEYTFMRRKFDDKIVQLQSQLHGLQKERDTALTRAKSGFTATKVDTTHQAREKQQLVDIRHAYETKMKSLLAEINDLKRKYAQTTMTIQTTRNQNESLLKSLRVNVETLKEEKKRMVKRMRHEAERVREQVSLQERRIQQLQRQQSEANVAKRRLEREHEAQRLTLKKRNEEVLLNNSQLKQLIAVFKKAVREGGMLDERLLGKVSHIIGGNFAVLTRGGFGKMTGKRAATRKKTNPIPVAMRAKQKKQLLDKALYQYIQGKQAIVEMEQLLLRRERLAGEKGEVMEERRHIYETEKEASESQGTPMETTAIELMDERIDLISAEIAYLTRRIQALQSDAAGGVSMDVDENETSHALIAASKPEKHVIFADEIVSDPIPSDEWADMDAFEEQFTVPTNAAPELAYDMTHRLLKSLESDECKTIAENLVEDLLRLRMSECNRVVTMQSLEKSVQDLRRTLIVMKRAAIATTIENERRIRRLEERDQPLENDDGHTMDSKIEEYINGGNTIFDKIYEDGLRGMITSPDPDQDRNSPCSSAGSRHYEEDLPELPSSIYEDRSASEATIRPAPLLSESMSRDPSNRDTTPSPDRFFNMIQKRMSWQQRSGGSESPIPVTMLNPAEFARYMAERDSSTSSIRSSHLRRSSFQSDYSSSQSQHSMNNNGSMIMAVHAGSLRKRALSFQQQQHQQQSQHHQPPPPPPSSHPQHHTPTARRRVSLRELSQLGGSHGGMPPAPMLESNGCDRPSSPMTSTFSCQRQSTTLRHPMPPASQSTMERSTTPSVFDRLSQTPTRASRAKMQYRHSSGSVDDLRRQWNAEHNRPESVLDDY